MERSELQKKLLAEIKNRLGSYSSEGIEVSIRTQSLADSIGVPFKEVIMEVRSLCSEGTINANWSDEASLMINPGIQPWIYGLKKDV